MDAANLELLSVLLYGQMLKTLSTAFHADNKDPSERLRLWAHLTSGPAKFRSMGAWMVTIGIAFIVPDSMMLKLMHYELESGLELGYIAVMMLGFAADNIFLILHSVDDQISRRAMEKIERTRRNGKNGSLERNERRADTDPEPEPQPVRDGRARSAQTDLDPDRAEEIRFNQQYGGRHAP